MKALVTGGAGFIGSHLVDELLARDCQVFVLDDLSTGRGSNLAQAVSAGAIAMPADVTDPDAVHRALGADPPQVVFHLAALTDRELAAADPGLCARIDVEGVANVLEAARRLEVGRVVLASSFEVYGEAPEDGAGTGPGRPFVEDDALLPVSASGVAKVAAEQYADLYGRRHGIAVVAARLGSVYGPRQIPIGGGAVVAAFARALTLGQDPVLFGDGAQTRDFLYVDDAVRLLLAAAETKLRGPVNAGTGEATSVRALIEHMRGISGLERLDPIPEPGREGEMRHVALTCDLATEALGWESAIDLDAGLELTLAAAAGHRRGTPRGHAAEPVADPLPDPGAVAAAEPELETMLETEVEMEWPPEPDPAFAEAESELDEAPVATAVAVEPEPELDFEPDVELEDLEPEPRFEPEPEPDPEPALEVEPELPPEPEPVEAAPAVAAEPTAPRGRRAPPPAPEAAAEPTLSPGPEPRFAHKMARKSKRKDDERWTVGPEIKGRLRI